MKIMSYFRSKATDFQETLPLGSDEYYHGTHAGSALLILHEGFRYKKHRSFWGKKGTFGQAVYLTKCSETALAFGPWVLKCRIRSGIRILRLDPQYDPKIIQYLRREFGQELLKGNIRGTIPRNKHLTARELIALLTYYHQKMNASGDRDDLARWDQIVSSLRQQLLQHHYQAVGECQDLTGLAVLDPSLVNSERIYRRIISQSNKSMLILARPEEFLKEVEGDARDDLEDWGERGGRERMRDVNELIKLVARCRKDASLFQKFFSGS